jgi:glyoxylase-like metal-dependent hydrolase (beta-lactamase superfamily II)
VSQNRWTIGRVRITRVVEIKGPTPGPFILPDAVPGRIQEIGWLRPHFATETGKLVTSVHAFIVESAGRRILVDTCVGNDKPRPGIPNWHLRRGPFLDDLATAGFAPESIDMVVCTHLHVDHVGWNTMLVEGRWVPTFPRALPDRDGRVAVLGTARGRGVRRRGRRFRPPGARRRARRSGGLGLRDHR